MDKKAKDFSVYFKYDNGDEEPILRSITLDYGIEFVQEFITKFKRKEAHGITRVRLIQDSRDEINIEWVIGRGISFPPGCSLPSDIIELNNPIDQAIVISFEYDGTDAIIEINVQDLDGMLNYLDNEFKDYSYLAVLTAFLEDFKGTVAGTAPDVLQAGIWTIFRYGDDNSKIREQVDNMLSKGVTPYISWHVGERGLIFTCLDRYCNLRNAIAEVAANVDLNQYPIPPTIH